MAINNRWINHRQIARCSIYFSRKYVKSCDQDRLRLKFEKKNFNCNILRKQPSEIETFCHTSNQILINSYSREKDFERTMRENLIKITLFRDTLDQATWKKKLKGNNLRKKLKPWHNSNFVQFTYLSASWNRSQSYYINTLEKEYFTLEIGNALLVHTTVDDT